MAQEFVVTEAGLQAVAVAKSGGPMVELAGVRLGSAFGYAPLESDLTLNGSLLFPPTGYHPISGYSTGFDGLGNVVCNFSIVLDDAVGDFSFGEVAMYLPNGTMFAKMALSYLQTKTASSGASAGNTIEIIGKLALRTAIPVIDWTTITGATANLAEVSVADLLETPGSTPQNIVVVRTPDEYGRSPLFITSLGNLWYSPQYDRVVSSGLTVDTSSVYSLIDSALSGLSLETIIDGRYLVRFRSGALSGRVRQVIATPTQQRSVYYEVNQFVIPTVPNGFQYRATVAGTTDFAEPTWPLAPGVTVVDGAVTWINAGAVGLNALNWVGSTGTAPSPGDTYDLLKSTIVSDGYSLLGHTHPASDIVSGILATARLGSGTANSGTFLRGDGTWVAISGFAALGHTHPASDIVSGIMATARLGTGTANSTTFLRGDGTWAVPAGGGGSGVWGAITGTLSAQTDLQNALNLRALATIQINGTLSITGGGDLSTSRTLSLVNDNASPGVSRYYGTDAGGTKGWFTLPAGGGAAVWGTITGTLSAQTDLQNALNAKANLSGATFTGNVFAPQFQISSDLRLKKDLSEVHYGYEEAHKFRPVMYTMISSGHRTLGFIAQEIQTFMPWAVSPDSNGNLTVDMVPIIASISSIQISMADELDRLRERVATLETQLS